MELTVEEVKGLLQKVTLGADGGWRKDYGYPDQWVGYLFSLNDHHQGSIAQKGFHATEYDRALIAAAPDLARAYLAADARCFNFHTQLQQERERMHEALGAIRAGVSIARQLGKDDPYLEAIDRLAVAALQSSAEAQATGGEG